MRSPGCELDRLGEGVAPLPVEVVGVDPREALFGAVGPHHLGFHLCAQHVHVGVDGHHRAGLAKLEGASLDMVGGAGRDVESVVGDLGARQHKVGGLAGGRGSTDPRRCCRPSRSRWWPAS